MLLFCEGLRGSLKNKQHQQDQRTQQKGQGGRFKIV